jgi:acetyltransferase
MLGFGGIYVEVLKDVVFAPVPVNHATALDMVNRLKASAILKGARGRPTADLQALADFIVATSRLAVDADGILDQMDFNPVIVYPEGQGVVAVDALIATAAAQATKAH